MENLNNTTYQFTKVPTKLMMLLDNNCRSMLFTLIQLSSCYSDEDGYFFRSNSDLQTESNLSKNLVIVTIDTLYTNGIVDVKCVSDKCKKIANYYKLNYNKILEYENISLEDTKNDENKIKTLKYKNSNYTPSYNLAKSEHLNLAKSEHLNLAKSEHLNLAKSEHLNNENVNSIDKIIELAKITATETAKSEHLKQQKVNTNIDSINIDNIYNINYKDNIINLYKEYNILNLDNKFKFIKDLNIENLYDFFFYIINNKLISLSEYKLIVKNTDSLFKMESYQKRDIEAKSKYL